MHCILTDYRKPQNTNTLENMLKMEYSQLTISILKQLKIYNVYKGCDYIVSSIQFIHKNKSTYLPITKVLYTDIAKQYNTSNQCVEKNIRKVIDCIWTTEKNKTLLQMIFGPDISKKPSNTEFLLLLYNHIESGEYAKYLYKKIMENIEYKCPINNKPCNFYNEILYDILRKIFK